MDNLIFELIVVILSVFFGFIAGFATFYIKDQWDLKNVITALILEFDKINQILLEYTNKDQTYSKPFIYPQYGMLFELRPSFVRFHNISQKEGNLAVILTNFYYDLLDLDDSIRRASQLSLKDAINGDNHKKALELKDTCEMIKKLLNNELDNIQNLKMLGIFLKGNKICVILLIILVILIIFFILIKLPEQSPDIKIIINNF